MDISVAQGSILARIILILISQWGQSNSHLKGLSYIQVSCCRTSALYANPLELGSGLSPNPQ